LGDAEDIRWPVCCATARRRRRGGSSYVCTVVSGIAGMQSMKSVGKTGGYALLYFEIVSTLALIIGLVVVNVVQPGVGMHIDVVHAGCL
jgi:Na+/H+-dicarboxylate symporter